MDASNLVKVLAEEKVSTLQYWLCDFLGNPRVTYVPVSGAERSLAEGLPLDGSSVAGQRKVEKSDLLAMPDLSSLRIVPEVDGLPRSALFFCDVVDPADRSAPAADSRSLLRQTLKASEALGFDRFLTLPELEFYYFKGDGTCPADQGGYFCPPDPGPSTKALWETAELLETLGIKVRVFHHEGGPAQHEIELYPDDALRQADNVLLARIMVKAVAKKHGLTASFMPKPIPNKAGSGMHVHQVLMKGGANCFADAKGPQGLSPTALSYIAGQLLHARELTVFSNQSVNSYKRLVPGHEAPVYLTWGAANRMALIRIPASGTDGPLAKRLEYRAGDPLANPYLLFGLLLAAGLDGISHKLPAPPPSLENTDALSECELASRNISFLPESLEAALALALASGFIKETLGEALLAGFNKAKTAELKAWRSHISDWEINRYL